MTCVAGRKLEDMQMQMAEKSEALRSANSKISSLEVNLSASQKDNQDISISLMEKVNSLLAEREALLQKLNTPKASSETSDGDEVRNILLSYSVIQLSLFAK
jgi:hypothetical protein